MRQQRRQGMSNILATLVLVGGAIGGGGILYALSTDMIETQFTTESIDILSAEINNTEDTSWLTISIKNTGNRQVDGLALVVNGMTADFSTDFSPTTLSPSKGTALTTDLAELVTEGTSVVVVVSGDTTSGGIISESITIRP